MVAYIHKAVKLLELKVPIRQAIDEFDHYDQVQFDQCYLTIKNVFPVFPK